MPITLPPIQIHARIAAPPAEIRPWSIDPLGIRELGKERGKGVRVGIIDTGIDEIHATRGSLAKAFKGGKDFTGSRHGYKDRHGHGTHVAGTIAGEETDKGGPGLAPHAELYIAKGLGDDGSGSDEAIAQAALWLRFECKCHIINLSLGGPRPSQTILSALKRVIADGGIVICAAGNDGDYATSWPANDEQMVSVAATDKDERPADFSSPSSVDVACPGVQILSLYTNGTYAVLSGTSMACPWFVGWLAIYFGDLIAAGKPLPKQADLFDTILAWTKDIGAPGHDDKTGPGLVSPEKYKAQLPEKPAESSSWFRYLHIPARSGDWCSFGPPA